jgi:uracil-DNA glycosylase
VHVPDCYLFWVGKGGSGFGMSVSVTVGKGGCLVLPIAILESLGIQEGSRLTLEFEGGKLQVTPESDPLGVEMRSGLPGIRGGATLNRGDVVQAIKGYRDSNDQRGLYADAPKLLAEAGPRAERRAQLDEPHMKQLSDFVKALREEIGGGAVIPDFDPWDGGVLADVLFLLEAPGAKAVRSGFISRNNPDETAKNFFELCKGAGIPRTRTVMWNVVPWYIGSESRIRPANKRDVLTGAESLSRLLDLLPRLHVVVLVGRKAEHAEKIVLAHRPMIRVMKCFHPSPLFVNRLPENRERLVNRFREVAEVLSHVENG